MTCGECFHGAGADSPMTLREACTWTGLEWKRARKILITQWHPACRHPSVRWSVFLSPRPLVFIMHLLFPCVRLFFAVWRCQGERVFFPCRDCTECVPMAVRRDTLCIVLGRAVCQLSRMALAEVFLRPQPLQVQSVRSHVKPSTDKFRPLNRRGILHNMRVKIQLSPDVGHPSAAVSVLGVSHWANWSVW